MVWLIFAGSSALLVAAAVKLADYGDVIAVRTKLGGMFIGTLLLAGATSLPELLTAVNSLNQGVPGLAAGSMFGSNMFNMLLLAVLDMLNQRTRILRRVALRHALTGSLAVLLIGLAAFFKLADLDFQIGWVGVDSLVLMGTYLVGARLLQSSNLTSATASPEIDEAKTPSLARASLGFGLATAVLVIVAPFLVSSSAEIAAITGLGTGFVGMALLAIVTSLPELTTTLAAVRLGAYDLAVGNLFGSNMFNMFALGLTDVFYLEGRFLGAIDPGFALAGLIGLVLTGLGLIGNLARLERRWWIIEADALLLVLAYLGGLWLLYTRGIGV